LKIEACGQYSGDVNACGTAIATPAGRSASSGA
jgi:hypothetical protein